MREPLWTDKVNAAGTGISALGLIVACVVLFQNTQVLELATQQMEDAHELSRRQYAAEMMRNVTNSLDKHRDPIMRAFPGLYDRTLATPLSRKDPHKYWTATPLDDDANDAKFSDFEIRNRIVAVLNYFEHIAYAYKVKAADPDAIRKAASHLLVDWYDYFEEFVKVAEGQYNTDPWALLTEVVQEWRRDAIPETTISRMTGVPGGEER